jgi:hypothetical protein
MARGTVSIGWLALVALALIGLAGTQVARAANAFTVTGVAVDQTAATTQAAKDAAIADGERKALKALFDHITSPADQAKLPKLADKDLTELVSGYEVEQEKLSSVRYIAQLTVAFYPASIRSLLRNAGVAFAEASSVPVAILPVLTDGEVKFLWEDANPWRQAWVAKRQVGVLVPWIVAKPGDAEAAITPDRAIAGPPGQFAALAQRSNAAGTVIAEAILSPGALTLKVTRDGELLGAETLMAEPGETIDRLFARAILRASSLIDERWKRDNLVAFGQSASLEARVALGGLDDWLQVRRRLGDMAQIQKLTVRSLSRREAQIALDYVGDAAQFRTALGQRGLALDGQEGDYVLRLPGGARAQP